MLRGCAVKSESRIAIESTSKEDGSQIKVECVTGAVVCDDKNLMVELIGDSTNNVIKKKTR